jgi:hypothetical protein
VRSAGKEEGAAGRYGSVPISAAVRAGIVAKLGDGIRDLAPDGRALKIAGACECFGARLRFRPAFAAVAA